MRRVVERGVVERSTWELITLPAAGRFESKNGGTFLTTGTIARHCKSGRKTVGYGRPTDSYV